MLLFYMIIQLNLFLSTINIEGVEIEILHNLLQSSIASAKRNGQVLKPFTSITEVGYNRGVAATIAIKNGAAATATRRRAHFQYRLPLF